MWTVRLKGSMLCTLFLAIALLGVSCSRFSHGPNSNDIRNSASLPLDDLIVTHDIAYLPDGKRHRLDVYAPRAPHADRPVIIYFYGGAWIAGAKADYAWIGASLARQGYVAVIADYRVYPEGTWPGFLQDCASAVRWTHDNAATYGGSPESLFLMGHSAGAYNATMLTVDHRWLAGVGMDPKRDLKGTISMSGLFEFVPDRHKLKVMFGPKHQWPDTQPLAHADGKSPPMLFLIGDKDEDVEASESEHIAAKLLSGGGKAFIRHYPLLDHGGTEAGLAPQDGKPSQLMNDINAFIKSY